MLKDQGINLKFMKDELLKKFGTEDKDSIDDKELQEALKILQEDGSINIFGHISNPKSCIK